jgi:hypothetical protein
LSQPENEPIKKRLTRLRDIATIASYLIAAAISLYEFKSVLPDWLFFLLQIGVFAIGVGVVWVVLASSQRLRGVIFRGERRAMAQAEVAANQLIRMANESKRLTREDFRIFLVSVKSWTDAYLWDALTIIVRQGVGTERYQSSVYGLLARTSMTLGVIYSDFDPSSISSDLLTLHKGKLEELYTQYAQQLMRYADQVSSSGDVFSKLASNMNDFLNTIARDMGKYPRTKDS